MNFRTENALSPHTYGVRNPTHIPNANKLCSPDGLRKEGDNMWEKHWLTPKCPDLPEYIVGGSR